MKKIKKSISLLLLLSGFTVLSQNPCTNGTAGGYQCNGIMLQSNLTIAQMGGTNYGGSNPAEATDSWGWTDPDTGKEYAIVGMNDQTAFVDISNPNNPIFLGKLDSHDSGRTSWWRDIKTYDHYAFIVSDNNRNHGMQVFDLNRLKNLDGSVIQNFTEDNHLTWGSGTTRGMAHNIIINETTGYAFILGSSVESGRPLMVDISDPLATLSYTAIPSTISSPTGNVNIGYCHDAQVLVYNGPDTEHNGKRLLIGSFSGSEDYVRILDVTNKNNVSEIGKVDYLNKYYTHQGWFTEDLRFFIVGDELDETNGPGFNSRTLVFDMQDLDAPNLHYTHYGATPAIDHNGYVKGNRFYLANYKAGMRVFKVDGLYDEVNPSMVEVESFDTFPNSNSADFHGAWNVYPFFESGNIIISDLDRGLFVVKDPNYDNTPPNINAKNITATLAHSGAVTVDAIEVDNGSTDNEGITVRKINDEDSLTFTCDDVGDQTVTYKIEDDYGNVSSQQVVITIESRVTTWNGSTWSENNSPGVGSNARITQNYNTSNNGNIDSCECSVSSSGNLLVSAETYIKTQKDIVVDTGGNLIVEHTANIVQTDEDAQVINNGTINVNLETPIIPERNFMLIGSPMSTQDETVYNNPYQILKHTTENFEPYSGNPAVNGVNFVDNNLNDFTPHTGTLNPGEGYFLRPSFTETTSYNYTYQQGTLNSGPISYDAFFGDEKEDSPSMLANPYASALDASMFIQLNPVVSEVYFWEHNTYPTEEIPGPNNVNFSMQDVSMYNGTMGIAAASGGTTPNGVIATGQGFGIKANNPGGSITFTNAMRLTDGNTTLRSEEVEKELLWLTLSEEEYNLSSTTGIGFLNNATDNFDTGYDAERLGTVITLFSHLQDGSEQLGIQGLGNFDYDRQIPLGFETLIESNSHLYKISLGDLIGAQVDNSYIYLIDNVLGTTTNLNKQDYVFTADNGIYNNRFTLSFKQKTFGLDDTPLEAVFLYPNPVSSSFTLKSSLAVIKNINFFDARGRRVINIIDQSKDTFIIDISMLEIGIYYLEVVTNSGTITKKVIKT